MKYFKLLLLSLLLIQCSSTDKIKENNPPGSIDSNEGAVAQYNYNDLSTLLQSLNGVSVTGYGPGASVSIRGSEGNSFYGNTEPLFILNGRRISRGYAELYNAVDVQRITKVQVLKGSEAAVYGSAGGNGVIIISTK